MKRRNRKASALRRAETRVVLPVGPSASELAQRRARKTNSGRVMLCTPSRAELVGQAPRLGSEKKLIYDSMEDAEWTARAIAAALGEPPMNVYVCPRSTRARHLHLTRAPLTERDRHAVTERNIWAMNQKDRPRRRQGEGAYTDRP